MSTLDPLPTWFLAAVVGTVSRYPSDHPGETHPGWTPDLARRAGSDQ